MHGEYNFRALKTVCGGIFHSLITYGKDELSERDWEYLHSHLHVPDQTVYCVETAKNGFRFSSKSLDMKYVHDSFSTDARVIEITVRG